MKNIAIKLTNISKQYTIHHEKPTLVEKFIKNKSSFKQEKFWALKNVNFTINKGELVGIVGSNGSGKTTLLKIITGITIPTTGKVKTYGKVVSLIDLEAGFHEDLSGYHNIYINGMLLGMKNDEIKDKLASIIDFADIKQFIDTPLFTYSAGMKLRLGFSILIHSNPDIVVLDEGMGAEDQNFKKKSKAALYDLVKLNKTVLFVTQEIKLIKSACDKMITLDKGGIFKCEAI